MHFILKMQTLITLLLLSALQYPVLAGWGSNCCIDGIGCEWIMGTYTFKDKIDDTYEGIIGTFETENIKEVEISETKYLGATFENNIITIFTTDEFKNFEKENQGISNSKISIKLALQCNTEDWMTFYQDVNDVNSYDPVLSQDVYEYSFGMAIPEDFDLTEFLPITAFDQDFKTSYIYFTMEYSEDLRLGYTGYRDGQQVPTSLKTLKEIKAPFSKEFSITATDDGNPPRSSRPSKLIVTVNSNRNGNDENIIHPPVFGEHLYFADYAPEQGLKLKQTIKIGYGGQSDTKIQQSDYTDFFTVRLKDPSTDELEVLQKQKLSDQIMKENDLLVIEIEAENPGLTIPGRTALVIQIHEEIVEEMIHPPVFEKHLYFADYTSDKGVIAQEPIKIKYGAQSDTKVQQSDYSDYLMVRLKAPATGELEVIERQKLPEAVLKGKDLLVIEIEAENPGLTIPGRTALIIRTPTSNDNNNGNGEVPEGMVHPPVFAKHTYFADYTRGKGLRVEENILIKYGSQSDTFIRQSGYEEYFAIHLKNATSGELEVAMTVQHLPDNILKENDLLMIEIEAENPGLTIPGRTALIIRLNAERDCYVSNIWTSTFGDDVLPLVLSLMAILIIVFLNVIVLGMYFRKRIQPITDKTIA